MAIKIVINSKMLILASMYIVFMLQWSSLFAFPTTGVFQTPYSGEVRLRTTTVRSRACISSIDTDQHSVLYFHTTRVEVCDLFFLFY